MISRAVVLSLLLHSLCWLALCTKEGLDYEDPFEDDVAQCQITVTPEMMISLANTLQTEIHCDDDLWGNFLLQYHLTQENLTNCMKQTSTVDDTTNVFCQELLDDVQRQMEQEHRKHTAELESKLHAAQREAQKLNDEKESLGKEYDRLLNERAELVLDLLLANIAIGDIKQAIVYYRQYPNTTNKLYEQIVRSVYRVTMHQDQRLLHLISFVRSVDSTVAKLALYRLMLAEIKKRPDQRNGYIAAVFALNVKADRNVYNTDQKLYTEVMVPLEALWKEQLANGNYKAVIDFATRQPKYYEELQTTLATVDKPKWKMLKFDKFVPYLNSLPQATQRVTALRTILDQIRENSKENISKHLTLAAKELDIAEVFMNRTKADPKVRRTLEELKSQFAKITPRKDYKYYLNESRKAKSG